MPFTVVVDGVIGAGKTTLVRVLRDALTSAGHTVAVVAEPVEAWQQSGVLEEFYATPPPDRRDIAYIFQTYTFVTRIQEAIATVAAHPAADVLICERSIFTDRHVFMELQRGVVGPSRMQMYDDWWSLWTRLLPPGVCRPGATLSVWLDPSLETCCARIAARARAGESILGDYLPALHAAHAAFLSPQAPHPLPWHGRPVVVLDGAAAEADFTLPGPAADRIAAPVVAAVAAALKRP